jgi:hypothetical protein
MTQSLGLRHWCALRIVHFSDVLTGRRMQYYGSDDFRDDGAGKVHMSFPNDRHQTMADHLSAKGQL